MVIMRIKTWGRDKMKHGLFFKKKTRQTIGTASKLATAVVLTVVLSGAASVIPDSKTSAAAPYYGVTMSSSISSNPASRNMCGGANSTLPVDYWAWISNPTLDENTGDITYRVNLQWRSCDSTNTRAYSIYDTGSREACVLSGDYGVNNSDAYDCVKYVGNPSYNAGNNLTCSGGRTNGQCTNSNFGAIRVNQNQPPDTLTTDFVTIRKSVGNWGTAKYGNGSRTYNGGLCQYYKTGSNWQNNHIGSRCMTLNITISWQPKTPASIQPITTLSPNPVEPGQVVQATAQITQPSGNMTATTKYRRYFWYQNDDTTGYDPATESANATVSTPPGSVTTPVTLPTAGWTKTVLSGYRFICTSLELYDQNSPTTITGNNPHRTCAPIIRKPYLRVVGGDINTTCGTGAVDAFWNGANGSGTDLALYTRGAVSEFASAAARVSPNTPIRPKGLTFANVGAGVYGQSLGAIVGDCAFTAPPAGSPTSIPPLSSMPPTASLREGVLYVNGNVTISGNILYANSSNFSFDNVPYFKLKASGNIYITSNVRTLDGIYEAGGTIYTCTGGGAVPSLATLPAECYSSTLTVNGALRAATGIKYLRLNGSVSSGAPGEIISYDPLTWLKAATPGADSSISSGDYDAYTIMPPVL